MERHKNESIIINLYKFQYVHEKDIPGFYLKLHQFYVQIMLRICGGFLCCLESMYTILRVHIHSPFTTMLNVVLLNACMLVCIHLCLQFEITVPFVLFLFSKYLCLWFLNTCTCGFLITVPVYVFLK